MKTVNNRAGDYVKMTHHKLGEYLSFRPNPLPPKPDIELSMKLLDLLSKADRALARLDGITELLPNPDFFVFMYVRRESASSSQIEGTIATFADAVRAEAGVEDKVPSDTPEIINHIHAMNYGLRKIRTENFPLTLRLIRDLHKLLLKDVRGGISHKTPGEFRKEQNQVGGTGINTAKYIPPNAQDMQTAMNELEKFMHDRHTMPDLIRIGLIHSQFENIHPFYDGNGRIGRLLITLYLCHENIIRKPMLYISEFFRVYRTEYYDRLHEVHEKGDYEGWIAFFLEAVAKTAQEATETARKIVKLRERDIGKISQLSSKSSKSASKLLDNLFQDPVVNIKEVRQITGLAAPSANALVKKFEEMNILKQIGTKKRNRWFIYDDYMRLFRERRAF